MGRRLLILGLVAVAAFAQIHTAAAQSNSPPFPRLGGYLIGGVIDYSTLPHIGNLQVAVLSNFPGYDAGGKNFQQEVAAVKALNPNIVLTSYVAIDQVYPNDSAFSGQWNAVSASKWFLRTTWPSGSTVVVYGGPQDGVNFISPTLNSSGQTYNEWMAQYTAGFTTGVAPTTAGVFTDDVNSLPRYNADYLQNGTTQTPSQINSQYQAGYADWASKIKAAMGSGYMVWANVGDWGANPIKAYNQVFTGGVMEHAIPGVESSGWAALMSYYKLVMQSLAPFNGQGPYAIFQQDGALTDYQGMRYGLTSCLLDNGYYYFDPNTYKTIGWFDEFTVNLGAAVAGPNNPTNGTYSNGGLTVWKQGVWRRDFTNGIALVNPRGNGVQTVTLETTYKHISGTQASSVNNGQSVTSVTLNDRDGVILLRTGTAQQPVPDAPTLTVQ